MSVRDERKKTHGPLDDILGTSGAINQVKSLIRQVAPSDISVLITGESGTGKELVARAIHALSHRHTHSLVTLNCGAIPEGIFESEIFGHEKGSFTSAAQKRQGYFEMADRGTLFLDEIGEMPMSVQAKILRVLETHRFIRVGGNSEIAVDVRVIAATNKELSAETSSGNFRHDLYFRLKTININIPPLRERIEDIQPLARHFVREFSVRNKKTIPELEDGAVAILERNYWAGNIRELKNFIESIVALSASNTITASDVRNRLSAEAPNTNLPVVVTQSHEELDRELIYRTLLDVRQEIASVKAMLQRSIEERSSQIEDHFSEAEEIDSFALDDLEREQIIKVLDQFRGNRRQAANALGIGERTLYRKLKLYGLR